MPKLTFDTQDAIPEGLREFTTQVDGKYVADVVASVKLNEFRDNNIRISQERDTLRDRWGKIAPIVGEDPDAFISQYSELNSIATQVKDGKLKASGDIEAELRNRVAEMKTGYDRQLSEAAEARRAAELKAAEFDNRFKKTIVDQAITQAVISPESGALASALPDILKRAYDVFKVGSDGNLVAKDGDAIIYGADGATPMSPTEWVRGKLREQAPYFYKNSSGGGATGSGTAGDAKFGGMAEADYRKLSPDKKLALANKMQKK